jgi:hypothetical protein
MSHQRSFSVVRARMAGLRSVSVNHPTGCHPRHVHEENEHIRVALEAGARVRHGRTAQPMRTLSNYSLNKTLRTLALILDEAVDAGWVTPSVARGQRTRETVERQRLGASRPRRAPSRARTLLGEDRSTDEAPVRRLALDQTRLQLDRDHLRGFER